MKNLFYVALLLGLATTAWGQDLSVATTEVTEVAGEVAMGATFVDVRKTPKSRTWPTIFPAPSTFR
jgi:hypothetical protein